MKVFDVAIGASLFTRYNRNPGNIRNRLVAFEETCLYYYDQDRKQESV